MNQQGKTYVPHDTHVGVWLHGRPHAEAGQVYKALRGVLYRHGFAMRQDPGVGKSIRSAFHIGRKGDLQVASMHSGIHVQFEFFQDLVTVNRNGGRYDHDKLAKMPYLVRLSFLCARRRLVQWLEAEGFTHHRSDDDYRGLATDEIVRRLVAGRRADHRMELQPYNTKDADGVMLRDGDVRYFRTYAGHLQRGTVYHAMNNMWMVVLNDREHARVGSCDLFTYVPGLHPRKMPGLRSHRPKPCPDQVLAGLRRGPNGSLTDDDYLLMSVDGAGGDAVVWWRPEQAGYTRYIEHAGRYHPREICAGSLASLIQSGRVVAVPLSAVEKHARRVLPCQANGFRIDDLVSSLRGVMPAEKGA